MWWRNSRCTRKTSWWYLRITIWLRFIGWDTTHWRRGILLPCNDFGKSKQRLVILLHPKWAAIFSHGFQSTPASPLEAVLDISCCPWRAILTENLDDNRGCIWVKRTNKHLDKSFHLVTSWYVNIFRFTGLMCGEFTGHRWIPLTKQTKYRHINFSRVCSVHAHWYCCQLSVKCCFWFESKFWFN